MKTILILLLTLVSASLAKAQITELETIFDRQGDTVTVFEVTKKAEVTGQFFLPDSTQFTVEELKIFAQNGSVEKLIESHLTLAGFFPPQEVKLGLMTNYYRLGDEIIKGRSRVEIMKSPQLSLLFAVGVILSVIGIIWVSVKNIGRARYKLFLFYIGCALSMIIFLSFSPEFIFWALILIAGASLAWFCTKDDSSMVVIGGLSTAPIAIMLLFDAPISTREQFEPYHMIYWQLIAVYAGMCLLGFIVREVVAQYRKVRMICGAAHAG